MTAQAAIAAADDQTAIRQILERLHDAWNSHDMDAYVADLQPDADWVNVVGMHWVGRETIRQAHLALHRGMFAHSRISTTDVQMRDIGPGVVLVVSTGAVEGVGRTPDGAEYPASGNRMTLVMIKADGRWTIAHAHNTMIDARAAAHDPAHKPA
jgi:uncharacterized protein (TIGR02246 family)